jgi:hypothetical protein
MLRVFREAVEVEMWEDGTVLAADVEVLVSALRSGPWGGRRRDPGVREVWMAGVGRHVVEIQGSESVLVGIQGHRHDEMRRCGRWRRGRSG